MAVIKERKSYPSIQFITKQILDAYNPQADEQSPLRDDFFKQVVTRCVADVAGVLQVMVTEDHGKMKLVKPGAQVAAMHDELSKRYGSEGARNLIIRNLPGFTKGQVHTPHPTEVLTDEAIFAERKFVEALLAAPQLFQPADKERNILNDDQKKNLHDSLTRLNEKLNEPLKEKMTIPKEMYRSILFSRFQFESVPLTANHVLEAVDKPSTGLSFEELKFFGNILKPSTWSPGDEDSKPDMTVAMIDKGLALNRRAVMFHYYRNLAKLVVDANGNATPEVRDEIEKIMYRLLKTGHKYEAGPVALDKQYAINRLKGTSRNSDDREDLHFDRQYDSNLRSTLFHEFEEKLTGNKFKDLPPYGKPEELLADLENLRKNGPLQTTMKDEAHPYVTPLDAFIIQVMNFRDTALRVQIRQSRDMHEGVMNTLLSLFPENAFPQSIRGEMAALKQATETIAEKTEFAEKHKNDPEAEKAKEDAIAASLPIREKAIDALLDAYMSGNNPTFTKTVQMVVDEAWKRLDARFTQARDQLIGDIEKNGINDALLDKLEEGMSTKSFRKELKQLAAADPEAAQKELIDKIKENGLTSYYATHGTLKQKEFNFYQTIGTFGIAVAHADQIQQYLIAECSSKTDMMEAFFMLKVMEAVRAPQAKDKIAIVNLVEYPDRVTGKTTAEIPAVRMTVDAMNNPYFRKHHVGIKLNDHLLDDYSLKEGKRRLTVAEAKRMHNLPVKEGDENKEIVGTKMMMGAGSDVTKAGGVAAAAAMMAVMEHTREALLDNEPPMLLVDYIGCGGGIHRSQPVSSAFETVQGRSMRQTAEAIAHKTTNLLTRNLRNRLAMNPDRESDLGDSTSPLSKLNRPESQKITARLNLGNLANVPSSLSMWESVVKPRTFAMMDIYNKLYKSPEFRELNAYSARIFVDVTQFAARPDKRVTAGKEEKEVFPPKVDVEKTRAIGFGAALNASGICAPMFYGASEYLKDIDTDPKILRDMYMHDPKAQDTINRITYGIVMADMDVAWKYLGRNTPPAVEELQQLAASTPDKNDREALATKCLAKVHLEYNAASTKLLKLQRAVDSKIGPEKTGKEAAKEILSLLPRALREQMQMSLDNIDKPRNQLADLFQKVKTGEVSFDKVKNRDAELYNNIIYPAMGTIYEWSEHTPRAYTRPAWGKARETIEQGRAA
jgi:phosphoenolpyruvate carboxylase